MGPTCGPPRSCRPQMGPMLAPWILLSGFTHQAYLGATLFEIILTKREQITAWGNWFCSWARLPSWHAVHLAPGCLIISARPKYWPRKPPCGTPGFSLNLVAENDVSSFYQWRSKVSSFSFFACIYIWLYIPIFTRGQFWPSGIVVACVCVCVCLSVCLSVSITCLSAR